ncbi:MAG: ornithine cyclodeaminase family protein, partial [Natronospirillum sp.]
AWIENEYVGVKQVNVFPGNNKRGMPGLTSHYLLSCGRTGHHLAEMDGNTITARRTAAASALASRYLAREDAKTLLMVGSGRMATHLIPAHLAVRDITRVLVWGIDDNSVSDCIDALSEKEIHCEPVPRDGLAKAVGQADIVSCATLSSEPLIRGEWLSPGTHVDLVGSFTPAMREADNQVMALSSVFVDTVAGALKETGDLIDPIREGAITEDDIQGEFRDLCNGRHTGRRQLDDPQQAITVFKSVGTSEEDLAAAILAYQQLNQPTA